MPKVLISDKLSQRAVEIFEERGIEVDFKPGLEPDQLKEIIGQYDGLAVRSATKATDELLDAAVNLKVIGRAGIGVDNIDVPAASARGVVVMNTPFGNSITTAEHAIAMMFSVSRQIPQANESTHKGKWEKSRFMGTELFNKTLGIIGAGNIGSIVADRANGLRMRVIAFDPYLTDERAMEIGAEKVELDDLLRRADFITLHVPLTDQTRNVLDAKAFAKMKKGVTVINCARGGLIVESALKEALESGHVAAAALDVFEQEPAKENPLFGMENLVCTPHVGASTAEAQENVAIQVAEQMADYLLTGAVSNALNVPSVTAEEAPRLRPYMRLAEQLGSLLGQVSRSSINAVSIEYQGAVAELNVRPLTSIILKGLMGPTMDTVNMVNAPLIAKERDIAVRETKIEDEGTYHTLIRLSVETPSGKRSVAGTLFAGDKGRIVDIEGIPIEAEVTQNMLYSRNSDKPGFIGNLGRILGDSGLNIASFDLGRSGPGGDATCLISLDQRVDDNTLRKIQSLPSVLEVQALTF